MDKIEKLFYDKIPKQNFNVYGILDGNDKIHTLGTDSKIIGRIFEMITQPILEEIAYELGMKLQTPKAQTIYPDFIMMTNEESKNKIAIDVKTTYVDSDNSTIKFTLGSFGSYMRDNRKNIEYRYTDYAKHYVIGFIYKRNDAAQESKSYDYAEREKIVIPYTDVKCFIQEKYKIAGDKPGSGNTENIGSFSTKSFTKLKRGEGPFSKLGIDIFELYWKYYPKYRAGERAYTSLEEFMKWLPQNIDELELLHKFDKKVVLKQIKSAFNS